MIISQNINVKFSLSIEENEFYCMLKNVNKKICFITFHYGMKKKRLIFMLQTICMTHRALKLKITTILLKKTSTINKMFSKLIDEGKFIKLLKLEVEGAEPEILYGAEKKKFFT